MSQRASPRSLCNAEAPGGGSRACLVHRAGRPSGLGPVHRAAMGPWSGALRAQRSSRRPSGAVPQCPAALSASRPTDGQALGRGGALVGGSGVGAAEAPAWPCPRRARALQVAVIPPPRPPTPPSLPPRPVGRRAGTSPAARTAGQGHVARGGQGSRGGAQGPATEAPAGSSRSRPGQVALSPGTDQGGDGAGRRRARRGRGAPLFGLPVSDPHAPWRVEVPPPYRRPDLDPLGQRLHDPAAVLNVEVVPSCL